MLVLKENPALKATLTIFSHILTVVSLVLAIIALVQARRTDATLRQTNLTVTEAATNTKQISQSITTSYAGRFPEFLPMIVDDLHNAKESILCVTFPAMEFIPTMTLT
ncbi:MAG: hypothetical protein WAQ52_12850 [Terriglobales bacterium]